MTGRVAAVWNTAIGRILACGLAVGLSCFARAADSTDQPPADARAVAPATVSLLYKFQPGQFAHYEVSKRVRYVTQQAGNAFEGLQQSDEAKHFRVVSVDEAGNALLEPVIDHVKMSAKFDVQPAVVFDSSKDEVVPDEFKGIKETVGRPLARFQVSAHGQLLKVLVVSPDAPKSLTDAAKKVDSKMNFLVVMPREPVAVGHKWKEKYETGITVGKGLVQAMPMQRQFELTAVSDGIATIKFRTTALAPVNDPEVMRQLVQQMPSGTVEFDIARGLIRSQKSTMNENVVNAFGPQTLLQVVGETSEKLLPADSAIQQAGFTREDGAADK